MKWPFLTKKKLNKYYEIYFKNATSFVEDLKNFYPSLPNIEIEKKVVDSLKKSIEWRLSEKDKSSFIKTCNKIENISFFEKVKELLFVVQQRYPDMADPLQNSFMQSFMHDFRKRALE